MNHLFKITALVIAYLIIFGCNKIQIKDYKVNDSNLDLYATENYNYQRNALSPFEIKPPLKLQVEDDFTGLPTGGFTSIDSILFFSTGKGYIFALNANSLKVLGKKKLGLASSNPPTIYKYIIYQTFENGDYGLIAYDFKEGTILWEIENNLTSSSPIMIDSKVYFQNNKGKIYCFNYLTGEIIWETNLKCFGKNALAYDNGKIISTNQNGSVYALEFTSGVVLWNKKFNDHIFSHPVIYNKDVYVTTYKGFLYQIDIENGNIIHFKQFSVPLYHAVTVEQNDIYVPTSKGEVKKINKSDFIEIWSYKGSGPAASPVVASENYIYFPTLGKYLYIIDKNSGTALQDIKFEGRVRTIPLIQKDKLVIACEDDYVNIYATVE